MKTELTCALFGILFFGSQCSNEETQEQKPNAKRLKTNSTKRYYQNASGLCGSWYRKRELSGSHLQLHSSKLLMKKNHTNREQDMGGF
uniref:Putative anticomplement protein ixac-b1 n=1 Tax=Ixodes ricinus TaxID=34613 RepID=V5GPK8_IXORI